MRKPIQRLRWYIGFILFLSTVINYIDRQTLSVLAPHIKDEFHWDNSTFALLIIAFRISYSFGQTASGRFLDAVGIRKGLSITVAFYSAAAMLTSFATGLKSLAACRFLLGAVNRQIGLAPRKPSPNGSPARKVDGQSRCSTAARRSEELWRR